MDLQKAFERYFNGTLRTHLGYPETFTVELKENEVILRPIGSISSSI